MIASPVKRKKILVVMPFPPWSMGGVERVVLETTRHLEKIFDIAIYSTPQSEDKLGKRLWNDFYVTLFRDNLPPFCFSWSMSKAIKNNGNISLIHAHNYSTFVPLIAAISSKDVPLVINSHYHKKPSSTGNLILRKFFDKFVGAYPLYKADIVICNSKSEEKLVLSAFPKIKRTCVVYNGAPIEKIAHAEPFESNRKKIVLSVCRLAKSKNVHLLLHALRYLPDEYEVVIVGTGPEEKNLRKLADKLNLQHKVRFLGRLSDNEVYRWYRTATVFVHLSEIESFGLTIIEALSAGTPVVANDDKGGLKETIDIFRPDVLAVDIKKDSADIIAKTIIRASVTEISPSLTTKLKLFAWENVSNQFREIYAQQMENYKKNI